MLMYADSILFRNCTGRSESLMNCGFVHIVFFWESRWYDMDRVDLLKEKSIGFIGAGKVGSSLGKFFSVSGIPVTGYYSLHGESAREAAEFTQSKYFETLNEVVDNSDVLFLTVPDGVIASVFQSIKDLNISNKFICHSSGVLSSEDAFEDIELYGATGYSIHPLFPISSKTECYRELSGAFFCIEGAKSGLLYFKELFTLLNIKFFEIKKENKIKYHAACAMASNLICGIIKESLDVLCECGFEQQQALEALKPLMLSNMNHIADVGPVEALTGPIERNDYLTVGKHLEALGCESKKLYISVSEKVLQCAKARHADRDYTALEDILRK